MRVLYVEDNEADAIQIHKQLQPFITVEIATSSEKGLLQLRHHPYDMVWIGLHLGGKPLNGLAFCQTARGLPERAGTLYFAMIPLLEQLNCQQLVEEGFDGCLSKPLNKQEVLQTLGLQL